MKQSTFKQAILREYETVASFLDSTGYKTPTVYKWFKEGVPAGRVLEIEGKTANRITRHEINPDAYPKDGGYHA